jgi:hypothetical protein
MSKLIRVGYDYLHNHTGMEKKLNVPQDHVIVDRQDWEEVVRFFNEHPEAIACLKQKPKYIIGDGQ